MGVDKSEVYVNTSLNTDGALIKVGDRIVPWTSEPDSTEKVELYKADAIELVEGEQMTLNYIEIFNQAALNLFSLVRDQCDWKVT